MDGVRLAWNRPFPLSGRPYPRPSPPRRRQPVKRCGRVRPSPHLCCAQGLEVLGLCGHLHGLPHAAVRLLPVLAYHSRWYGLRRHPRSTAFGSSVRRRSHYDYHCWMAWRPHSSTWYPQHDRGGDWHHRIRYGESRKPFSTAEWHANNTCS